MHDASLKTIAVIGRTGQLARVLAAEGAIHHYNVINLGRNSCDLGASEALIWEVLERLPPVDGVINAAAYTHVDQAETDVDLAMRVNGHAPGIIAKYCQSRAIPFIHISTDYVFDGVSRTPYLADAETKPINAYGRSKLAGETAALSYRGTTVLRASWLFDGYGQNFFTKIIALADKKNELTIVSDQIGRPVDTTTLAKACFTVLGNPKPGIYHVSGNGPSISWAGFTRAIFIAAPRNYPIKALIKDIPATEYPTAAKRPAYSVLDNRKFETDYGIVQSNWGDMIDHAWVQYISALADTS